MDQNGIGAAVLSVSSPALGFVDGDAARELARSANESARALIMAHPDRFGAFALLPLPNVDASLCQRRTLVGAASWLLPVE
jgi:6-methylsalicylate decarboxylase